jgi:hypothetical protein
MTEKHGLAPAIGSASQFMRKLEQQIHGGRMEEAIEWLSHRIRNKSVPVNSGMGPRQRLRAANLAFNTLGRQANDLSPQRARAIARDVVSTMRAPDVPDSMLATWRQQFAADRAWVAERYLPEWRSSTKV